MAKQLRRPHRYEIVMHDVILYMRGMEYQQTSSTRPSKQGPSFLSFLFCSSSHHGAAGAAAAPFSASYKTDHPQ